MVSIRYEWSLLHYLYCQQANKIFLEIAMCSDLLDRLFTMKTKYYLNSSTHKMTHSLNVAYIQALVESSVTTSKLQHLIRCCINNCLFCICILQYSLWSVNFWFKKVFFSIITVLWFVRNSFNEVKKKAMLVDYHPNKKLATS